MENVKIQVVNNVASLVYSPIITSGMTGLVCNIELDDYWEAFDEVIATVLGSDIHLDCELDEGSFVIPWECLTVPSYPVYVGVYGATSDGERKTPTTWCNIGAVKEGALPSTEEGTEPSKTIVRELREHISELETEMYTKVEEAPIDEKQYVRQNGNWSEIDVKTDYEDLDNLPTINGTKIIGDMSLNDIGAQEKINDISSIRSNASAGKTASDNLAGHTVAKNVPSDAKFTDTVYDDTAIKTRVSSVESKIPNQATDQNQLADKQFVNSTVGTNTAIFRGTFDSVEELEAYAGEKTNNDYAFVIIYDEVTALVSEYDRYKYNGTSWVFEYSLNNSSFTAEQWAAINSGITPELAALAGTAIQSDDLLAYHDATKQDAISDLATIRSGAELGATAVQPEDIEPTEVTLTFLTDDTFTCNKTPEQIYTDFNNGKPVHIYSASSGEFYISNAMEIGGAYGIYISNFPNENGQVISGLWMEQGGETSGEYEMMTFTDTETVQSMIDSAIGTIANDLEAML